MGDEFNWKNPFFRNVRSSDKKLAACVELLKNVLLASRGCEPPENKDVR